MNNETIPLEDSLIFNQNYKYILSLLNEEVSSTSWFLPNGLHKIGRLPEKEIILDDVTVSRHHAFITVDDEEISITDEESTNGIFINGELLTESTLKSGDRLQVGKFSLIVTKTD
ncbi:FHA domain-containing protein [Acidimicrobiia bacterium]|nr:FHA domain-containing protein [Acidimicrobiia bacterium]MDB4834026.1 FHA domain-containing protein [Acidimicrobiia bacterium]